MQITFMIGNGFDLNLGLKTTYDGFIEQYKGINPDDAEIVKLFKEKILAPDIRLWSSAELAFGACTKDFHSLGLSDQDYCTVHEDFCEKLGQYLRSEEEKVQIDQLVKRFGAALKRVTEGFNSVRCDVLNRIINKSDETAEYSFIIYNYTEIIDKILSNQNKNALDLGDKNIRGARYSNHIGKIIHVHGTTHAGMVLGVNDVSQFAAPELFNAKTPENMNSIVKIEANKMYGQKTDEMAHDILKHSNLIYIYGMSIGETDALWWKRIEQIMMHNPNIRIVIHEHELVGKSRTPRIMIQNERTLAQRLLSYSPDSKLDLNDRLYIAPTNIFSALSPSSK